MYLDTGKFHFKSERRGYKQHIPLYNDDISKAAKS